MRAFRQQVELFAVGALRVQEGFQGQIRRRHRPEFPLFHRRLHPKIRQHRPLEPLEILGRLVRHHMRFHELVEHVRDVGPEPITVQGVAAALVNHLPLRVHHVVVLQQAFPHAEVVFLHFLLGPLNGLRDHGVLDDFALLVAHPVHHLRHPVRAEQAHQVVLERHVELGRTRIPLTPGTPAQLAVHPPAVVPFRSDDGQAAQILHLLLQLDVRTPARHVRGNRHRPLLPRARHDLGLLLVHLRVQDLVLDAAQVEHL